jgi:hypothetical protein
MFDPGKMNQDRSGANADRILVAQLTGEARHRARWRPLTEDEEAAALAELRALAGGRADLLAEVAGIFEGTSEGEPDEPLARSAARLCRMAGADAGAIPAWIEEGRRRSANARHPPFSGGRPLCSPAGLVLRSAARCRSPVGKPAGLAPECQAGSRPIRSSSLSERLINAGMAGCSGLAAFRGAFRLRWAGAGPVFLDV